MLIAILIIIVPAIIGSLIATSLKPQLQPLGFLFAFSISAGLSGYFFAFCARHQAEVGIYGLIIMSLFAIVTPILSAIHNFQKS